MVIITGANGFIGSAMVWELNKNGITDIICVDSVDLKQRPEPLRKRKYSRFLLKNELWKFLDNHTSNKLQNKSFLDPERISRHNIIPNKQIEWVIHMGACSSTTETNWDFLLENNTEYTQRLIHWCAENDTNLIYASSAATYGDGQLGFDDQTDPERLRPLNLYGESKVLVDRWILKQNKNPTNWYGLRFFNVFGPNEYLKESMASVAFKAFHQIRQTNQLGLFKSYRSDFRDGEQMRDFIYVKDVTSFMWQLMQKRPLSGIYNMGYGQARSWLDLAKASFQAMNLSLKINWLEMPENIRDQYQYFTQGDMTKWHQAGMSAPQWPLELAVKDYIQNHLNQSDPWL